ncbi:hypothetical protein [Epilithonimonas vandammei]|uniref:hypothetical protein n=1 Tax=Epilithonimonas vandammei TaxID=2487072 RepID=UPI0025E3B005|nr:hypothetical protein [Epilithonimonas vandammei]
MNIGILKIADDKIEEAFNLFSELPFEDSVYSLLLLKKIMEESREMLSFYIDFFKTIFPDFLINLQSSNYYSNEEKIPFSLKSSFQKDYTRFLQVVRTLHVSKQKLTFQIGFKIDHIDNPVYLLHTVILTTQNIDFKNHRFKYLNKILVQALNEETFSIKNESEINYRQFLKDSKDYYGSSHQAFVLKMKMVNAIRDIMFTNLTLKEIAFKNNFSSYIAMYNAFHKTNFLNLSKIPRYCKKF